MGSDRLYWGLLRHSQQASHRCAVVTHHWERQAWAAALLRAAVPAGEAEGAEPAALADVVIPAHLTAAELLAVGSSASGAVPAPAAAAAGPAVPAPAERGAAAGQVPPLTVLEHCPAPQLLPAQRDRWVWTHSRPRAALHEEAAPLVDTLGLGQSLVSSLRAQQEGGLGAGGGKEGSGEGGLLLHGEVLCPLVAAVMQLQVAERGAGLPLGGYTLLEHPHSWADCCCCWVRCRCGRYKAPEALLTQRLALSQSQ